MTWEDALHAGQLLTEQEFGVRVRDKQRADEAQWNRTKANLAAQQRAMLES
jgi:basic membrane lipoprotein Med (substrate-binding protein (PBP1-ABC) superfamily)